MEVEFNSVEELYKRIRPALTTKVAEMRRNGFAYIKEEDVWNFLKEKKWKNSNGLKLYEMTSDVLNTDEILIDNYLKDKMDEGTRKIYFEVKE